MEQRREYGDGSPVLVDIEREECGPEFAAALYESYATDCEPGPSTPYSRTAHRLAEELEVEGYERLDGYYF